MVVTVAVPAGMGNEAVQGQAVYLVRAIAQQALGGGVPLVIGEEGIGGIGVSGSNGGQPGDEACAAGGLKAIESQLK